MAIDVTGKVPGQVLNMVFSPVQAKALRKFVNLCMSDYGGWQFTIHEYTQNPTVMVQGSSTIENFDGKMEMISYSASAGPELVWTDAVSYSEAFSVPAMRNIMYVGASGVAIELDVNGTVETKGWYFGTAGEILFPDGTEQYTAYNGTEKFSAIASATGTVVHDCANGYVFYHTGMSANFTANLTNLNIAIGKSALVTMVLAQGATPRVCNAIQVDGVAKTILWLGSATAPAGNANKTDSISFNILRVDSTTYIILGQLRTFG